MIIDCTVPYFGFKAKLLAGRGYPASYCTVPYFGFKAKLHMWLSAGPAIVLCLILDSRQNFGSCPPLMISIVLCLILDSRQNDGMESSQESGIVLCLILDSRQNCSGVVPLG